MSIPKEIKSNIWLKNWSYTWRAAFASLYQLYATDLERYLGRGLKMTMLICEKDVSSNYVSKKDLNEFCLYLADLIMKDDTVADKWIQDSLSTADDLIRIIEEIKNETNPALGQLISLKKTFYKHIPPHFALKKVIDYLPGNLQEKLTPRFREVRIKTDHLFNEVDSALRVYTDLIAQKSNRTAQTASFLSVDEVSRYFENGILPPESELDERSKGTVFFYKSKKAYIFSGKDFQSVKKMLFNDFVEEFRGSVAFKGFAKGLVRIVFDPQKVSEFNVGDILVTGMTRPEFLPIMKKAGAFVTDAGGILSHAAIMARELKKPCIIGTEVASKVLKDGDLVEVDAAKGIVKILKRA